MTVPEREGPRRASGKDRAAQVTQPHPWKLSLRNSQRAIYLPFITLFCQAGSSCKHLTLSHLLWFIRVQGELLVNRAAAGPSIPVLDEAVPREAGPRCMAPVPPTQSMLKQQVYKHPSLSQRPGLRAVTFPCPVDAGAGGLSQRIPRVLLFTCGSQASPSGSASPSGGQVRFV